MQCHTGLEKMIRFTVKSYIFSIRYSCNTTLHVKRQTGGEIDGSVGRKDRNLLTHTHQGSNYSKHINPKKKPEDCKQTIYTW